MIKDKIKKLYNFILEQCTRADVLRFLILAIVFYISFFWWDQIAHFFYDLKDYLSELLGIQTGKISEPAKVEGAEVPETEEPVMKKKADPTANEDPKLKAEEEARRLKEFRRKQWKIWDESRLEHNKFKDRFKDRFKDK